MYSFDEYAERCKYILLYHVSSTYSCNTNQVHLFNVIQYCNHNFTYFLDSAQGKKFMYFPSKVKFRKKHYHNSPNKVHQPITQLIHPTSAHSIVVVYFYELFFVLVRYFIPLEHKEEREYVTTFDSSISLVKSSRASILNIRIPKKIIARHCSINIKQ